MEGPLRSYQVFYPLQLEERWKVNVLGRVRLTP